LPDAERFAFLQAIIEKKWLKETAAKELFKDLNNMSGGGASYEDTIAQINQDLNLLLLQIRRTTSPNDNTRYVGFVNKENDEIAKNNGTGFSSQQVQYLRCLIEAIAVDPDADKGVGSISSMEAMHVDQEHNATQATQGGGMKPMSLTSKEEAIKLFIKDGWLSNATDHPGYYSLGVRTFLELPGMLLELDLPAETRENWEAFL